MPTISTCPECDRSISFRDGLEPFARLRCPLCGAEFALCQSLAGAHPVPPEALPVGEITPPSSEAPQPTTALPPIDEGDAQEANDDTSRPDLTSESEAEGSPSSTPDPEPPSESPLLGGENNGETDSELTNVVVTSPRRRARRSPGFFSQMLGVVGGGFCGLAIGYLILVRFAGPRGDFLGIRDKLPAWLTGAERPDDPKDRNLDDEPGAFDWQGRFDTPEDDADPPDGPSGKSDRASGQPLEAESRSDESAEGTPQSSMKESRSADGNSGVVAASFEDSAADGNPETNADVGPRNVSRHSVEELRAALQAIDGELGCDFCGGTGQIERPASANVSRKGKTKSPATPAKLPPCEHCGGKPSGKLTPAIYGRLCQLAEMATFVDIPAENSDRAELRTAVQKTIRKSCSDQNKIRVLGRQGGEQLTHEARQTPGIVLAGHVREVGQDGELFWLRMVLYGSAKTVMVFGRHMPDPALAPEDRAVILGSVIDDPSRNLAGYHGSETVVVWGGLSLRLDDPPK